MAVYSAIKYNVDYGGFAGSLIPLATTTISTATAAVTFDSGIDTTYKDYFFLFNSVHPGTNAARLTFQVDTASNTNFNQTITSTSFKAYAQEDGNAVALTNDAGGDQAQGTGFQNLSTDIIANDADAACSGYLILSNPSSTSFHKNFQGVCNGMTDGSPPYSEVRYTGGYVNTITAVNKIRFKMDSGNIDSGIFQMFGIH